MVWGLASEDDVSPGEKFGVIDDILSRLDSLENIYGSLLEAPEESG